MKPLENSFSYKTIEVAGEGLFKDRGSKFLGYVFPVASRQEALMHLDEIRDLHKKARHHCFAWRIGTRGQDYRAADDGEPSGSAGQPMLNQLLSHEITNVVAIVVRYFGGTKLGVPGLINAYKMGTLEALEGLPIVEKDILAYYSITTTFDHASRMMTVLKDKGCTVQHTSYTNKVTYDVSLPAADHEQRLRLALTVSMQLPSVEMLDDVDEEHLTWNLNAIQE